MSNISDSASQILKRVAGVIKREKLPSLKTGNFQISVMWAFLKLGYQLKLEAIQRASPDLVDYVPELTPALKMELHGVKLKVFASGHVEFYSSSADDLLQAAEAVRTGWARFAVV